MVDHPFICENKSSAPRLFGSEATTPYPKCINDHVVSGAPTVNPEGFGTKAALHYVVTVRGGRKAELRLKLHRPSRKPAAWAGAALDQVIAAREADADEVYAANFNEHFHGDNGAGLSATRQTGWTALAADLILDPPGGSSVTMTSPGESVETRKGRRLARTR
jgi:hypothetical protein